MQAGESDVGAEKSKMCINTEWGGLGDDHCLDNLITPYDTEVDIHSVNPGKQRLSNIPLTLLYSLPVCNLVNEWMSCEALLGGSELDKTAHKYGPFIIS